MAACAALSFVAAHGVHAQAPTPPAAQAPAVGVTLPGHVPALVNSSTLLGPVMGVQPVSLALTLPLRNTGDLTVLLHDLYDTNSPLYGQYLTPQQFTDRFGPTQADYDAVVRYAKSKGLTVTGIHSGRTLVDVAGSAGMVQQAFGVRLQRYLDPTGREFYAPDADPTIDASLAGKLTGVLGLDTAGLGHPSASTPTPVNSPPGASGATATGSSGSAITLTPVAAKTAYNLNTVPQTGAGQSVVLFEADGYNPGDITAYENYFGLPHLVPQNKLVDGASGQVASGLEDVLDIEMVLSFAPNVSNIYVYETPNSTDGFIKAYTQIADDNLAQQVSTSWYWSAEGGTPNSLIDGENREFEQMMAQGQTIYSASGDNGVYANGSSPSVQDPASQPFVCAVGGTTLSVDSKNMWYAETTWQGTMPTPNTLQNNSGGSGGGISAIWPIPYYQSQPNIGSSQAMNSVNYRNTPDVSLAASPNSGYYIYWTKPNIPGSFYNGSGTSAAAPLWAAFTALVNQQRAANGYAPLGLANQSIYQIGLYTFGSYGNDFHDITTGSNGYSANVPGFPAVPGYDLATGWGSFNGANLLADLAAPARTKSNDGPLYRLYNASNYGHAYTLDITEARSLMEGGDHYEGVQCHLFFHPQDAPGLTPFYRMYSPQNADNFYTTSTAERDSAEANGYQDEGIAGYLYLNNGQQPAGSVPLRRTFDSLHKQHFYTDNYTEYQNSVNNGATGENICAYVLP